MILFVFSGCPKAPEMEAPLCQKAKCCVPTKEENKSGVGSNGILGIGRGSSKSAQNTPTNSRRRPSSFVLNAEDIGGDNGEVQVRLTDSFSSSHSSQHDSL